MDIESEIRKIIELQLDRGKKFIIYPFGKVGLEYKKIMHDVYGIKDIIILDNKISKYNSEIHGLSYCKKLNKDDYVIFIASTNIEIYDELKKNALNYFQEDDIVEMDSMKEIMSPKMKIVRMQENKKIEKEKYLLEKEKKNRHTKIGKYSYGPLTENNHYLIKSIGSFCSFADGVMVVRNHPTNYISTHPFIYEAGENDEVRIADYEDYSNKKWFFKGVKPKGYVKKNKRSCIGNDVWLGRNVIITNGADIGNGVIAGAGAVITKDIPDYAVVVGVPARIIRYRYNKSQIDALNRIKWWDWSDELIRERYNDFYLQIDKFIEKYDNGET